MPKLITRLKPFEKFEQLVSECRALIEEVGYNPKVPNQISLQVRDPNGIGKNDDAWYGSCGWLKGEGITSEADEDQFSFINPKLKGSLVEEWLRSFGVPLYRARLLLSKPRSCYSVHQDPFARIHIPLFSNPDCLFLFPRASVIEHLPADGHSYWIDTREFHSFSNCSTHDRVHICAATRADFSAGMP